MTAILKYKAIDVYRKRNSGLRAQRLDEEPDPEFFEKGNGHWKEQYSPSPFRLFRLPAIPAAKPLDNRMLHSLFHSAQGQDGKLTDEFKQRLQQKINDRLE